MMTAIGAYDLSKIDEAISDLDTLGNYFLDNKDTIQQEILTAIDQARIYGEFWDIDYFIDIVQFLNALDTQDPEGTNLINQLIGSIEHFVISKNHLLEDNSIGFNFYFPRIIIFKPDCIFFRLAHGKSNVFKFSSTDNQFLRSITSCFRKNTIQINVTLFKGHL